MGPIMLDELNCEGRESHMFNCSHIHITKHSSYCEHSEDVGVFCKGRV